MWFAEQCNYGSRVPMIRCWRLGADCKEGRNNKKEQLTDPCPHFIKLTLLRAALRSLVDHDARHSKLRAEAASGTDTVTSGLPSPAFLASESGLLTRAC